MQKKIIELLFNYYAIIVLAAIIILLSVALISYTIYILNMHGFFSVKPQITNFKLIYKFTK